MNAIFKRVSVRKFQDKKIEEEKIELLMKAAMAAPSAHNQQPWEYYVVTDENVITQLSECGKYASFAKEAPLVIVPCMIKDTVAPEFARVDVAASVENILLEATELELGGTWCGVEPHEDLIQAVRDVLSIRDTLIPFCLIVVGYPSEQKEQENRYNSNKIHRI